MRELTAVRIMPYRTSIFEEMGALAHKYGAIDLGSGMPSLALPTEAVDALEKAIADGRNQYSPVAGEIALRQAIAGHASRFYGQSVDPLTEVSITNGVTEAVQAAMTAFLDPGDEVVILEPAYESYAPSVLFAGGVPVPVRLMSPDFRLDPDGLAAAFSSRTKALILNNPHNPTGRVFARSELDIISELCRRFDVLAISDEVYEHIIFDGCRHIRLSSLPGMWERTLTLSGASKTFSCTGWRIGWAIGPAPMQEALIKARQFTVFCAPTPLQLAIVPCLDLDDSYFAGLGAEYQARRDILLSALAGSPFQVSHPVGGFFALAAYDPAAFGSPRDCCGSLAAELGVVPVPLDSFYLDPASAEPLIRFTFCHARGILQEAGRRLSSPKAKRQMRETSR